MKFIVQILERRGVIIKEMGKFWDNVPKKLDPPHPLSDISDNFQFLTYLKNADHPSRIKLRYFS